MNLVADIYSHLRAQDAAWFLLAMLAVLVVAILLVMRDEDD